MSATTKQISYHCAEKYNSDGAGDHDCIASQWSMPRHGELHLLRVSDFKASGYKILSSVTTILSPFSFGRISGQ